MRSKLFKRIISVSDQARKFVEIFSAMERLPQLLKYYHKCQKGALCQQWRCLVEEQDLTVSEWISSFYDSLLSNWQQQVTRPISIRI